MGISVWEKTVWEKTVWEKSLKSRLTLFRLLPFWAIGVLIFAFNANQDTPYLIKGYATLLEVQLAFLALFFMSRKALGLRKKRQG
jgi:hypothetical protein